MIALAAAHVAMIAPLSVDLIARLRASLASTPRAVIVIGRRSGDETRIDVVAGPQAPAAGGDTVFEVGSLTKPVTGTLLAAAARLADVRLDEPIDALLPPGSRAPSFGGLPITLLDLATQRSGLPRLPDDLDLGSSDPYADYDRAKLLGFLGRVRLTRAPGAEYEYSNVGYGVLGTLLADRARENYAALARERVFVPLGMIDTAADASRDTSLITGYDEHGTAVPPWHFAAIAGAGAMRATANDLLRFAGALFPGSTGTAAADVRAAALPRADAAGERIGLGWMTAPGTGIVWHNGGTYGAHAFLGAVPERRAAVVILTNVGGASGLENVGFTLLASSGPA